MPDRIGPIAPERNRQFTHAACAWEFDPIRRELRSSGRPVPLGGRAFEIVEVLVRSAGELVSKDDLMNRVWPGAIVEDSTLHVHMSAIRKALGPDRGLIKTVSGRGYRLEGSWTNQPQVAGAPVAAELMHARNEHPATNFSGQVTPLVGRFEATRRVRDLLSAWRVVTLTGPGGIGKTALGIKAARGLLGDFEGGSWLVELASLTDPELVPSAVANVLGQKHGGDKISSEDVARAVGEAHLLLMLDNCEHVIEAVARLAESLVRSCPRVTVLATSRELLRIAGEAAYRVPPLDVPAPGRDDADHILLHSAVELFIARIKASDSSFSPRADELPDVGAICRHLDGIPLAIEFAAAQASTFGTRRVAAGLHDRFALLTRGRRTALPRHRTLRAALDWSYELLSEAEQRLLRHLAIFSGGFTAGAAAAVVKDGVVDASLVMDGIANLVAKSLVVLDRDTGSRWYLLETIRAYALEKLGGHGEHDGAARHHATYFRDLFPRSAMRSGAGTSGNDPSGKYRDIDNVRAALDWCFSAGGDRPLGVDLTVGYGLGLPVVVVATGGGPQSLDLLTEALDTAVALEDLDAQARALIGLLSLHNFRGELEKARAAAERLLRVADRLGDAALSRNAGRLMGNALVSLGRPREARGFLESYLNADRSIPGQQLPSGFQTEDRGLARAQLSRALWMLGFIDQARHQAEASLDDPRETDHPLVLCRILYFGSCRILPTTGDFAASEQSIARLAEAATSLNEPYWHTAERFLSGKLMIERGQFAQGVAVLNDAFDARRQTGWRTSYPEFKGALAIGLAGLGQLDAALAAVNEGLDGAVQGEQVHDLYFAELLRIKGEILLRGEAVIAAEDSFLEAIDIAQEQEVLLWELRATLSLARVRVNQGRGDEARRLMGQVYDRFTEGFEAPDLRAAKAFLDDLAG